MHHCARWYKWICLVCCTNKHITLNLTYEILQCEYEALSHRTDCCNVLYTWPWSDPTPVQIIYITDLRTRWEDRSASNINQCFLFFFTFLQTHFSRNVGSKAAVYRCLFLLNSVNSCQVYTDTFNFCCLLIPLKIKPQLFHLLPPSGGSNGPLVGLFMGFVDSENNCSRPDPSPPLLLSSFRFHERLLPDQVQPAWSLHQGPEGSLP